MGIIMTEMYESRFVEIATAGQGPTRFLSNVHIFGRREDDSLAIGNDEERSHGPRWKDISPPRSDGVSIRQISVATMTEWSSMMLYVLYEDGALARMHYSHSYGGEQDWVFLVGAPAAMSA